MTLRKSLLLMLVLTFVFVLAACGGTTVQQEGSGGATTVTGAGSSGASSDPANSDAQNSATESGSEEGTLTIEHLLDVTEVGLNPQTVVVFDFGVLDTLDALGIEIAAVPQNSLPSYLAHYGEDPYINAGSLKEPDFETIYGLQPDLIIISGRQSDLYEEFTEIGPTIYMGVETDRYLESFEANVTLLGQIFQKEEEVEQALADIKADIDALNEITSTNGKNGLVVLTTGGKVSAYGPGSRFGIIHDEFGVTPVDENIDVSTHGMSVSFEYIAEMNPDYLFVIDRDAVVSGGSETAKDVIENELVKNTTAYKEGNIIYLDPNYWYLSGGGLQSVREMANEIKAGISE